ncbi:hypothetical protein VMT65_15280 [Nocardia sp. CDC153]|nr:hypothetical protein [Nocardia sp. CDC153]MEC3954402.1 hypothetical protein [Nocardia sp. CDC153]
MQASPLPSACTELGAAAEVFPAATELVVTPPCGAATVVDDAE